MPTLHLIAMKFLFDAMLPLPSLSFQGSRKPMLALILLASMSTLGWSQQDVLTGQYLFNGLLINPAYAGASGSWETMAMQRLQWVEFDGAPNTGIVSAHGALANNELGVGGMIALDAVGITSTFELSGHGAYHLDMGESNLSFGLRGGLLQYRASLSDVDVINPLDPVYQGTQLSAWVPRFGFGMLFQRKSWFVGLSTPMLFVFDKALDGGISPYYRNHLYLQGGMNLRPNSWLSLSPSVLFRSTPDVPSILDLNLVATVSDSYTLGLGYRTGSSFTLITQCRITNQFRIGYTRDFTATDIRTYAGGTHEIVLGWDLNPRSKTELPLGM
jgi:type IX secretion system PorP/SprF family membrane protein